jgi:hypothetical protein
VSSDWNPAYIGDGVYALFDGNGIQLKLGGHDNECTVYLELDVMENLQEFWARCQKDANAGREGGE